MKKIFVLLTLTFLISCSDNSSESVFTLETFNSSINQSIISGKSNTNTEIVTTINGVIHTLNLEEDFFL
jgi:hypothetical protein